MSKYVWPAVFILIISICCLIFFQWNSISVSIFSDGKNAEQNVAVRHIQNHFQVEQSIKHIPEGGYEIRKPKNLESFSCKSSRHQSCVWLNREKTKIAIGEGEEITFTYRMPSSENPGSFALVNWLLEVRNVSYHSIRIQLTEEKWRQGEWVAAADSIGKKKMDNVDYYVFETNDENPALYWHATRLQKVYGNPYLTVYAENSVSADFSKLKDLKRNGKLLAVITNKEKKLRAYDDLLLIPARDEEAILRDVLNQTISVEKKQEWLLDVIISAFLERPYGSEKAQKMYLELERALPKKDVKRWLSKILSDQTVISAHRLDEYILEATGMKTNFFTVNEQEKAAMIPYFVVDARPILINGKPADRVIILYHDEQPYISFIPLAEHLGFKVQSGTNEALMKKGDDTFHFYYERKIFYQNGRSYGLSSNPFLSAGEETYIHADLLFPVFGLNIHEANSAIHLQ